MFPFSLTLRPKQRSEVTPEQTTQASSSSASEATTSTPHLAATSSIPASSSSSSASASASVSALALAPALTPALLRPYFPSAHDRYRDCRAPSPSAPRPGQIALYISPPPPQETAGDADDLEYGFVPARGDDVEPPQSQRSSRQSAARPAKPARKIPGQTAPRRNSLTLEPARTSDPRGRFLPGRHARPNRAGAVAAPRPSLTGPRLLRGQDRRVAQLFEIYSSETSTSAGFGLDLIGSVLDAQLVGFAPDVLPVLPRPELRDFAVAFEMYEPGRGVSGAGAPKRVKIFTARLVDSLLSKTRSVAAGGAAVEFAPGDERIVEFYERFLRAFKRRRHQGAAYLQPLTLFALVNNLCAARKAYLRDLRGGHGLLDESGEDAEMREEGTYGAAAATAVDGSDDEEGHPGQPTLPEVLAIQDDAQFQRTTASNRDRRLALLFDRWIEFTESRGGTGLGDAIYQMERL